MSKARRFGWAIAIVAAVGFIGSISAYLVITRTEYGRDKFIHWALNSVNGTLGGRGRITVGVLHELSKDGLRVSDVSLLDTAGTVVMHVNELTGAFSYASLLNKQIHITRIDAGGVKLLLRKDFTGPWNIAYVISGGPKSTALRLPGFGDDVRIDELRLTDAVIGMRYPWTPNDMFTGKVRDSVIAVRKSAHEITVVPQGLIEARQIILPRVVSRDVIVANPKHPYVFNVAAYLKSLFTGGPAITDANAAQSLPSSLQLDSLNGSISDPAVRIAHAGGQLHWTPDSMMLDLPNVALPRSTGSAKGTVSWNQPGAVRYDVNVVAKAGLSDLTWIWDVLPDSGNGSANVRMRTLADADDAEYSLSKLDVSTMNSRVAGDITVVVRPADMLLQGVDLTFTPMRSELLRRLSYDAVPKEVQGTLRGRLIAKKGGPLNALMIDRLDASFADDQVAGAQSSLTMSGLVGLGANPTARNVRVSNAIVDLRSVQKIAPTMPPVDGIVRGDMLIASADMKQATVPTLDVNWTDGEGNASHVTGRAEARFGGKVPYVDTELQLDPLALKALVRVDTTFPISSALRGTVSAQGALDSLAWTASLLNGASKLEGKGTASLRDSVWSVKANTELAAIDLREWIGRTDIPGTKLNGTLAFSAGAQLRPDTTTRITDATFNADIKQAAADSMPAFDLKGSGALDARRLQIDSTTILLGGINIELKGALARDSIATDTLVATVTADSVGAARPELLRLANFIAPIDTALAKSLRGFASDTLEGDVSGSAVMVGSLPAFNANVSLSARNVQVGIIDVRRVFGSVRATGLPDHAHFDATASIDDITGLAKIKLQNAEFRIEDASPDSGRLVLNVVAQDTTALRLGGDFTRKAGVLAVSMDSVRFNYGDATWRNARPALLVSDSTGLRIDSLLVRSNQAGVLSLNANVPVDGEVSALLHVERFPAGEAATFAMSSPTKYRGLLSGETKLSGTRLSPRIVWNMIGDSVGTVGVSAPPLVTDGTYENKRLVTHLVLEDSVRSRLRFEARVPMDLSLQAVEKRLLSENLDAEIVADTLQLAGLPIAVEGVSNIRGSLAGRIALSGTFERPIATGRLILDNFSASADALGIKPDGGQVVLVAEQDQVTVERFRFHSGERLTDTVGVSGVLRFPADKPMTVDAAIVANNAALARQRDGTDLDLSGTITAKGELKRPDVTASLFVPRANLVADPLGARAALDLNNAQARELLGAAEIPLATSVVDPLANLGNYMNVTRASITMGSEVWVRTPEAAVQLTGELDIKTGPSGLLAFDGEVNANRGTFRLELGPVRRSFSVDSGKVRFFGSDAIKPIANVYATHIVRVAGGTETPIHVAISGTFDSLALKLSSDDDVFSGAPESEIISLLIFGAPTFALNSQAQNTVKTVAGVGISSLGGFVEGFAQRLIPGLNKLSTLQLSTAGDQESVGYNPLDNLNLQAGKQLGDRTFLRFNGGLCRANSGSNNYQITTGLSAEYRIRRALLAQIGVDQGASPCTQLGANGQLPKYQFGFDLFREWVF